MCGIIAVVRRRSTRTIPTHDDVMALVSGTTDALSGVLLESADAPLSAVADRLETADRLLRGTPGLRLMLSDPGLGDALRFELDALNGLLDGLEAQLDAQATVESVDLESVNASLIRVRDAAWNIERDRLRAASVVADLGGHHRLNAGRQQ